MAKTARKDAGTDALSDQYKSVFSAVEAIRRGWNSNAVPDQPIVDPDSRSYKALHLRDGTVHWIVALRSVQDRPVVAAIAADPQTGMWYALAVLKDTISYICEYPPEMVKKKYKSPPMGFASAMPRVDSGGATRNGRRH